LILSIFAPETRIKMTLAITGQGQKDAEFQNHNL